MNKEKNQIEKKKTGELSPVVEAKSHSIRFTEAVMKEFNLSSVGSNIELSSFQQKLIQNYFIKLDDSLKTAETKRLAKSEQYRDALSLTWDNVNMSKLALEVVALSSVGLDPLQPNHINLIPYKNKHTNKYDVTAIIGYRGLELKARKYGLNIPDDVIVELVYSSDVFKQKKKDSNNRVEGYSFEITNEFDRGTVVGGFYYHSFYEKPEKNKIRVFSLRDIEKRKPAYASAEFWGGIKDKWVNGKKEGKETVDGWKNEMSWKTIYRAAFNDITIDSEKINIHVSRVIDLEDKNNSFIPEQTTEDIKAEIVNETASEPLKLDIIVPEERPDQEIKQQPEY